MLAAVKMTGSTSTNLGTSFSADIVMLYPEEMTKRTP